MPRGQYPRKPGLKRNQSARPLEERFWAKVNVAEPDECWKWTGFLAKNGYGRIQAGRRGGQVLYTHRLAYELSHGPIPDGLVIDHLCRNRWCVNPAHLETVTASVNTKRAHPPSTHCPNGHERTAENTYYNKHTGYPGYCRICRTAKRKAAPASSH